MGKNFKEIRLMMQKICPQCHLDFETKYISERYCSGVCADAYKRDQYLARWANGKGNAIPKASQRMKLHKAGWSGKACY